MPEGVTGGVVGFYGAGVTPGGVAGFYGAGMTLPTSRRGGQLVLPSSSSLRETPG